MQDGTQWRQGRRVAIVGAGPGGLSAALSLTDQGYDVRVFERHPQAKPIGGAVMLNIPVLMILRKYGVDLDGFTAPGHMWFGSSKGRVWAELPAPAEIERVSGIKGFTHGVLRSSAYKRMLELIADGVLQTNHALTSFEDRGNVVQLRFRDQPAVEADILLGADGVRSTVSRQLFGDPALFNVGIRVWLSQSPDNPAVPRDVGRLSFKPRHQISYFPMMNDGVPGFEWWIVEPFKEGSPSPADKRAHLLGIAKGVAGPVGDMIAASDMNDVYEWHIFNRASMASWSRGRVACLGDAVHPVSPYAGYGMGMAIEDGYFLGKYLAGRDLGDAAVVADGFAKYEKTRIGYVNKHVEHARDFGRMIHNVPKAIGVLRNMFFDRSRSIRTRLQKGYLEDAIKETYDLKELHVAT